MKLLATGLNAFDCTTAPEGVVTYVASPRDVMQLVASGRSGEVVILAQGGTTTFLSPVLAAGTRGILTMSGAPQSHLGILSREFQIPCIMTVALEGWEGRYVPGESGPDYFRHVVEALQGRRVRLDCSDATAGRVYEIE